MAEGDIGEGVRVDELDQPFQPVGKKVEDGKGDESSPDSEHPRVNQLINVFHQGVEASGANFGFGEASRASRHAVSGPVPRERVDALIRHFVEPEPFEFALQQLRRHAVVTLCGPEGSGKLTSAVNLLVRLLGADAKIVRLSLTRSLKELAEHQFDKDTGYLLPGWFGPFDQEAEHHWERIQGDLREKGSFLVVTSSEESRRAGMTTRIEWSQPDDREAVIREYVGDGLTDADIATVVETLPEDVTMARLVEITDLLAQGLPPEDAISSVLLEAARDQVRDWFESNPTREQVIDVTVLAFLPGLSERRFGECRDLLKRELAEKVPAPSAMTTAELLPGSTNEAFPQARARQLKNPLIRIRKAIVDGRPRRLIELREPEAQRFLFAEMTGRFDEYFWDAVRSWLEKILIKSDLFLPIAAGLARLAGSSFDEVESSYLVPWANATGRNEPRMHARQKRLMAVHVLWFMCFDEDLAPVALRIATGWASKRSTHAKKYNAIIAFSGPLGGLYPLEAVKNLWRLSLNRGAVLRPLAIEAFGGLFLSQEDAEGRARVIQFLRNKIKRLRGVPAQIEIYGIALRALLAVYGTEDPQGRPLMAQLLCGRPDLIDVVGYTWSALLVNRPVRRQALTTLYANLDALRHHDEKPELIAQRLGDVLGGLLSEEQQADLASDFAAFIEKPSNRRLGTASITAALLAAIERARRRMGKEA